jgi:hypothetical protein
MQDSSEPAPPSTRGPVYLVAVVLWGIAPAVGLVAITASSTRSGYGFPVGSGEIPFGTAFLGMPLILIAWSIFTLKKGGASTLTTAIAALPLAALMCVANLLLAGLGCGILVR